MLNTSHCSTGSHHACHTSWKPRPFNPPFFIPTVFGSYLGSCWFGSEGPYDSEGHSHRGNHGLNCEKQCRQYPDLYLQPGSPEPAQPAKRFYYAPPTDRVHLAPCEGFSQTLKPCKYNDPTFCPTELWAMTLHIPPPSPWQSDHNEIVPRPE